MKRQLLTGILCLAIMFAGCKTNSLSGVYVCDQSNKKRDTTIDHGTSVEAKIDLTCMISEIHFKGNTTVSMKIASQEVSSSYVIDKEYIRIKGDNSDLLLKMEGDDTLVGEGIFLGTYRKK